MAVDVTMIARRQLLAAAGIAPALAAAPSAGEGTVLALQRRRHAILAHAAEVRDEDELDRLCRRLDGLARGIAAQPTPTLTVARLKLLIVAESYVAANTTDGFDLRLFNQVLGWIAAGEGAS